MAVLRRPVSLGVNSLFLRDTLPVALFSSFSLGLSSSRVFSFDGNCVLNVILVKVLFPESILSSFSFSSTFFDCAYIVIPLEVFITGLLLSAFDISSSLIFSTLLILFVVLLFSSLSKDFDSFAKFFICSALRALLAARSARIEETLVSLEVSKDLFVIKLLLLVISLDILLFSSIFWLCLLAKTSGSFSTVAGASNS